MTVSLRVAREMKEKSFSIVNFCQNLVGCRRRKSNTKKYEELSAKNIIERILRRKSFPNGKLCEDKRRLSKSSPNLCAQVNGNLTLKPTISIKRENTNNDPYWEPTVQNAFYREEKCSNFSVLKDLDRNILKEQNWYQHKSTTTKHNKRHPSFKHNYSTNLEIKSENKLFKSKTFMSCPNINQYFILPKEKMDSLEDMDMIDNIDDFTTNLFLDDVIIEESNIDLVSIKLDYY